jgi:iron complex outermembrane receptor protein
MDTSVANPAACSVPGRSRSPHCLRNRCLAISAVGLALTPCAETAFAQEAAAERDRSLFEVVVTARKREETLIDTPASVTALGAETLTSLNVENLADVGKYVPNLNITRFGVGSTAQASIFIRGIGLQDHLITTDPSVGVYLDGVYLGRQLGSNLTLQNIERVEVLRGPQGTLYGRNTLGGAVNIITRRPGTQEGVSVDTRIGTRQRLEASFYADTRLAPAVAASLTGAMKRRDGVGAAVNIDNPSAEIGEEMEISGRTAVYWTPSERFSVLFAADAVQNESGQSPYKSEVLTPAQLLALNGGTSSLPAGVEQFGTRPITPADQVSRDDLGTTVQGLEDTSVDLYGTSLTAQLELSDELSAKLIGSYRQTEYTAGLSDDDTALTLSAFPESGTAEQVSVELQLNGKYRHFDFVSGLYYFHEDGSNDSGPFYFLPFNAGGPGDFFRITQKSKSYAVFANLSYHFSDALTVGAGARYSDDTKDATALFPSFAGVTVARTGKFDAITADANISYQVSERLTVYGLIQRGYQPGSFAPRPFGGPAAFTLADKTTATSYEIGFKGPVTDVWTLLLSGFWTEYDGLGLPFNNPNAAGFSTTVLSNDSRGRGVEVESLLTLGEFRLNGSLGYLDAEITEVDALSAAAGARKGDRPALSPEITAAASASYRWTVQDNSAVTAQVNYSYRDSSYGQSINTPSEVLDARDLVGFTLTYENLQNDWSLGVYGANIFNEVYDVGRLNDAFHGFVGVVMSNDRSEFGVRFTKKFLQ